MTATVGYDYSTPISYSFENDNTPCSANAGSGGSNSGWQSSNTFPDSGLDPNKCYGYKVTARDNLSIAGTVSSISTTYTSANVPGQPTLSNPQLDTLDIDNDANGNPSSNPTTYFAAQVTYSNPSDSTWDGMWVNASGNPSGSEVWLTDAELDAITLQGLNPGTTYGVSVKARNENLDNTSLGSEGQGVTFAPLISVIISGETIPYGVVAPGASKSTLQTNPVTTQSAENNGNVPEDFTISSTNAVNGVTWTLSVTPGFAYEFSTDGGSIWTPFISAGSPLPLVDNIADGSTQAFDLRITVPTDPGDTLEKTITNTITASQAE
jgi:hypothetical protein